MSTHFWTAMTDVQKQDWLLAPELESLWDKLDEVTPPRRGLTLGAIVTNAIALADAEGMEAVSMARIAKGLGFATMAIYRHVPSKSALVVLMIDRAIGAPPTPVAEEGDWRTGLAQLAKAQTDLYRQHPWILSIPISTPPATPNNLRWLNAMLSAVRGTPLNGTEKLQAILLLISYIRGHFQLHADDENPEAERAFLSAITRIARGDDFAELRAIFLSEDEGPPADSDESDFAFGLNRLLDGLAVIIDQRQSGEPPTS